VRIDEFEKARNAEIDASIVRVLVQRMADQAGLQAAERAASLKLGDDDTH
jgi:hypothetical protein